ncbi:putative lipase (class 3) [Lyophyllum shimeji]|uniref:Lipase (Class 3) n=1 Tax=Lyophyllum shimeji TaxID=47721 RepID=A0A9P3UNG4_LYOSH|nr:putative lipase (class 3) [Lyophyllum shimeji]
MFLGSQLVLSSLLAAAAIRAAPAVEAPSLEARQSVTTLTAGQVAAYKPYSYYAASAYCQPASTLAWNCGGNCNANPGFKPVASGGNGDSVQFWYVGYDPTLQTVIVAYQGTDTSKILPLVTDADFFLDSLNPALFPGVSSSVRTHDGFGDAHAKSATAVLAAVQTAMARYATSKVTIVGHSLGGAIALIASVYLPLHLPAGTVFKTITYGAPRVGNQEFADYVNARLDVSRVVNQDDIVPIVPGRFLGFHHVHGEKHILNSLAWVNCPGQDNTDSQCTIGYVPNIFEGETGDHSGPYDGVRMVC